MTAACLWPVSYTCLPEVTEDADVIRLQECVDTAVGVLWAHTGRQYGCCPRIVRPCPTPREDEYLTAGWMPGMSWYPELDGGVWRNIGCGCGSTCQIRNPAVIHLPGPVCSIEAVTIDGAIVDSSVYTLEGDRLYHSAGAWPSQDFTRPDGSPGTWSVTYGQGRPAPHGAAQMVGLLALEFWKACTADKTCRLPKGVESLTRRGVAIRMSDPAALFREHMTGLPEVDMWTASINPNHLMAPAVVSSPDYPSAGVV